LDDALEALARKDADKAELVKLRFYVGLSIDETAQALGVSEKTVKRHWVYARASYSGTKPRKRVRSRRFELF